MRQGVALRGRLPVVARSLRPVLRRAVADLEADVEGELRDGEALHGRQPKVARGLASSQSCVTPTPRSKQPPRQYCAGDLVRAERPCATASNSTAVVRALTIAVDVVMAAPFEGLSATETSWTRGTAARALQEVVLE